MPEFRKTSLVRCMYKVLANVVKVTQNCVSGSVNSVAELESTVAEFDLFFLLAFVS